ncbi:MAG: class I SAM-dependent methyltransferase [bacterium]|nr:class I SAM-dependent methyltransferase [bacterium]
MDNVYFDQVASSWDSKRRIRRAETLANIIKEEVPDMENKKVLEFGCGTGLLTFQLYQENAIQIYGYDLSPKMCSIYEKKIELYEAFYNVHLIKELTEEKDYDLIYSSMVFHHIINLKEKLEEVIGLLAAGGTFLMIDLDKEDGTFHKNEEDFHGHNGFGHKEVKTLLQDSGLVNISVKTVYQGTKYINNQEIPYSLFVAKGTKR